MTPKEFKAARIELGLTQTDLAVKLGWSATHKHVSSIENSGVVQVQTALAIECLLRRSRDIRASMHPSSLK